MTGCLAGRAWWRAIVAGIGGGWNGGAGLAGDCRANCSMIACWLLSSLLLCVAAGVDLSRWKAASTQARQALDAALLGGGRMLQLSNGDRERAIGAAQDYFAANLGEVPGLEANIAFHVTNDRTALAARGSARLKTTVLSVVGIAHLPVLRPSDVTAAHSSLDPEDGQARVEIALAVDLSEAVLTTVDAPKLKGALHEFSDLVLGPSTTQIGNRVAIVPFAETVGLSADLLDTVRAPVRLGSCSTPGCRQLQVPVANRPDCAAEAGNLPVWCRGASYQTGPCVGDRDGAGTAALRDAPPSERAFPAVYLNAYGKCRPAQPVLGLTAQRSVIRSTIDAMSLEGPAAGHLGIGWAWYLLSPRWSAIWSESEAPQSYALLDRRLGSGAPMLRKIVVLVSAGRFERVYCEGLAAEEGKGPCSNGSSHQQARQLCQDMVRRGLELFVVGLNGGVDQEAHRTLRDCGADRGRYYDVSDANELRQALRDIALEIARLSLKS